MPLFLNRTKKNVLPVKEEAKITIVTVPKPLNKQMNL